MSIRLKAGRMDQKQTSRNSFSEFRDDQMVTD